LTDFYVYILRCNDDSYYVGHTDNIETRLAQHNNKECPNNYTSDRLPVILVFLHVFGSRNEAFEAERKIKRWTRKKKEALIDGNMDLLMEYSKKRF
jgi:predicted GIY-YIG superfamily endonuclease